MNKSTYIYEEAGMNLLTPDNMFYYYKRQTPKQTIEIKKTPDSPAIVDIYNNSKYEYIDSDEDIDMDAIDIAEDVIDHNDLLTKLTKLHSSITTPIQTPTPNPFPGLIPEMSEVSKRLTPRTKKNSKGRNRRTKHANRALPKYSY